MLMINLISLRKIMPKMLMAIQSKEKEIWRKAILTLVKSKRSTIKETEIKRPREETVALMKKLTSLRKLIDAKK